MAAVATSNPELALAAYESFAPFYDRFTEDCQYDKWLGSLESWARSEGLSGRRVLDVACGTGKSFEPMLARGYDVTACDLSPAMVEEARRRSGASAEVVVADMRRLPWASAFDLVTCIDDAINYLLSLEDLERALGSMAVALRPGGFLVFDANTLATYRTTWAEDFELESGPVHFRWCAEGTARFVADLLKRAFRSSVRSKLGFLISRPNSSGSRWMSL